MPGDASFANVSLLLHGEGSDGAVTFSDSSQSPKTITGYGGATISTAQKPFGSSSIFFDGSNDYLTASASDAFAFGSGDFTIEAFVRAAAFKEAEIISINSPAQTGWWLRMLSSGAIQIGASYTGSDFIFTASTGTLSLDTWTHVAYVRSASTLKIYIGGVNDGSVAVSGAIYDNSVAPSIGRNSANASWFFSGYMRDLRVTKGVARYTSTFTPPSAAFPDTGTLYTLSGTVRDATNTPAARKVVAYRDDTNALIGTATSDATTGAYSVDTTVDTAHTLVFYPAGGESLNALVRRGVLPIET